MLLPSVVLCWIHLFLSHGKAEGFVHSNGVSRARFLLNVEDTGQIKEKQASEAEWDSCFSKKRRRILLSAITSIIFGGQVNALECDDGGIVAENSVPGAYQQICMSLQKRSIRLKSTGETVSVLQGTGEDGLSGGNSKGSVTGRTGVALWNSGILLTRLLDEIAGRERNIFVGKTILELGCGTAMASIAASKLGANFVYSTDGNEEVVALAKANLELNVINKGKAAYLKWGSLDAVDYYDIADIVIGSDLTYNSGSWGGLAETFESVLKPNGIVIYLTLGHSGFNLEGELGGFLTLVESQGTLEVVKEGSPSWPFPSISSLNQLLYASLTSKEREVVASTGGFKSVILKKKRKRR